MLAESAAPLLQVFSDVCDTTLAPCAPFPAAQKDLSNIHVTLIGNKICTRAWQHCAGVELQPRPCRFTSLLRVHQAHMHGGLTTLVVRGRTTQGVNDSLSSSSLALRGPTSHELVFFA